MPAFLRITLITLALLISLLTLNPAHACDAPAGSFCVDYFSGRDLTGQPLFTTTEATLSHTWWNGSPAASVPVDQFSARWRGRFNFDGGGVIFRVLGDDGVRLKLDGQTLIDGWKDQGPTEYRATVTPTAGEHLIEVEYYDAWGGARVEADWEPVRACDTPTGQFCVAYYANTQLSGNPRLIAHETNIVHNWWNGGPDASVPVDQFSARWTGRFQFAAGSYIFRVMGDDGVRMKVDGQVVIDGWKDQGPTEYRATVSLTEGVHLVEVEYYEAWGGARVEAGWESVLACDVPANQFCVAYYDNANLSGNPRVIAHESGILHDWGLGSPDGKLPFDTFSGRWQGDFDFMPGTYTFTTSSDDGVRLWVDGQALIDSWMAQAGAPNQAQIWLIGRHRVTVDYFEGYGNAKLQVGWTLQPLTGPRPQAPIGSNAASSVGTNLSDWNDYSTEQPFLDVFKTSRAWITQAPGVWDTGEEAALDLDANGWVRSLPAATDTTRRYRSVTTLMLNGADLDGLRQGGEYIVLYDGEGTLSYSLGARKNDAASRQGRDVITVDKNNSGGIQLTLAATDPNHTGNYLRNIRVVASGLVCDDDPLAYCLTATDTACQRAACRTTEAALPDRLFHPVFLRTLVYYKSLRFMNPMSANVIDSSLPQISQWSDRATLSKARWNGQPGIPAEVAVALSNQMRADPWINMPHRATDDYIRQFARLTRASLAADRKVYVEYGNEIWNTAFSAGAWVEQQGMATWPNTPDSPYTKRINWYGKRTAEMCDLWKSEWAGAENRVVCVLAAQGANPWTASAALDCQLWNQAPCQSHGIGAVAMAPYFGHYLGYFENAASVDDWFSDADGGLQKLFSEVQTGGQITGGPQHGALDLANQWTTAYANLTRQRGLKLLAYEGGQHLVGVGNQLNNQNLTNLFVAANRDARMGAAYLRSLQDWKAAGGDLFVHFTSTGQPSRYGSWGALENMWQPGSPKLEALIQFILANPAN